VAGVAGFACAKLRPFKAKLVKATTKIAIMFSTLSPHAALSKEIIGAMPEPS
jgi:hypothetical protein